MRGSIWIISCPTNCRCSPTAYPTRLRGTIPTGNARDGLGTHHVSIEPGILFYRQLSDRFVVEGELRDWASLGGTDFAGNILRYGIGASYRIVEAEFIGNLPP